MRIKYVGSTPITFVSMGLEAFPGEEFVVSDDEFPAYISRSDIVVAENLKPVEEKPSRARRSAVEESAPVDRPDSAEESASDVTSNAR